MPAALRIAKGVRRHQRPFLLHSSAAPTRGSPASVSSVLGIRIMLYFSAQQRIVPAAELERPQYKAPGAQESLQPLGFPAPGAAADANQVGFSPVGLGKPLTILIHEVYTGRFPRPGFLRTASDMLVTSAIKSIASFDEQPLALNFLQPKTVPNSRFRRPGANRQGTALIYYSPAVVDISLTLDISMVFDTFSKELFDAAGDMMQSAAAIPLFFAHSTYLLGAGAATKLIGSAAERLFDGSPSFRVTAPLDIELAGNARLSSGFLLLSDGSLDREFCENYHVNERGQVVDGKDKEYQGEIPFVLLSIDGTLHPEFASFTPRAASAAVLSRFLGTKDGGELKLALDACRLYSDFKLREQRDALDEQIKLLPADQQATLKKKRDALTANISTDLFKK
jgi:hypothetical protein